MQGIEKRNIRRDDGLGLDARFDRREVLTESLRERRETRQFRLEVGASGAASKRVCCNQS